MIRARNLHKIYHTSFGSNHVLKGISFDLPKGEKLGILGRNGAGKSTLIRLISGAELPTRGAIERTMSVSWPLAFGGAFQPTLTGKDNVRFISRIYDQDFERNLAFVEEFAELGPYLGEPVRSYSSGMRARLAFAISMIIEFDCFLIDEIGAVGDARFHERCERELFLNRADRAMVIISHDAGYVRDHCTRFAVLHDGHLTQYDDFDHAYDIFKLSIGLSTPAPKPDHVAPDRTRLIEATQTHAVRNQRFHLLVQQGDWRRDARDWAAAEAAYAEALALFPYQRSYWVQHAHVTKEGGHPARAELSYRTACALGEPLLDVREYLLFVMEQQGTNEGVWPLRGYQPGPAVGQAPGAPDVHLFALALWNTDELSDEEQLSLIRQHGSCDALLAAMIADSRYVFGHGGSAMPVDAQSVGGACNSTKQLVMGDNPVLIESLVVMAFPADSGRDSDAIAAKIEDLRTAWPIIRAEGGFDDWPLTREALLAAPDAHNLPTGTQSEDHA